MVDAATGMRLVGPPKHPARYAQFKTALNESVLRRFLALVLFLDRAKASRLLPADPVLFAKVWRGGCATCRRRMPA